MKITPQQATEMLAEMMGMCKHSYKVSKESTGFVMPIEWTCRKCGCLRVVRALDGYEKLDINDHNDIIRCLEAMKKRGWRVNATLMLHWSVWIDDYSGKEYRGRHKQFTMAAAAVICSALSKEPVEIG
jgi:hypothetical protein